MIDLGLSGRLVALVALVSAGCLRVTPRPAEDVAACVVPRVVSALTFGLVLPIIGGRRSGTLSIDVAGCGSAVVDATEAQRIGDEVARAAPGLVALVALSDEPCVDAWAQSVGMTVVSVAQSLPSALASTGSLVVEWGVPECALIGE